MHRSFVLLKDVKDTPSDSLTFEKIERSEEASQ